MVKKYVEIVEELDVNSQEVPQILRMNVVDDAEAEQIYSDNKASFGAHKAQMVEENHGTSPGGNKPCKAFEIKDGTKAHAIIDNVSL